MSDPSLGTALVIGASAGIGAVYAGCLAKRGYNLILVARNEERLKSLSARLTSETGRVVRVVPAGAPCRRDAARQFRAGAEIPGRFTRAALIDLRRRAI